MSDCCETSRQSLRQAACPVTGTPGTRVRLQAIRAILSDAGLRRLVPTPHYFCPDPRCEIVYFSEQGQCCSTGDVRTPVWQKEPMGSRLLCYCFGENEQAIAAEIAATGTSKALERVKEHIRSGSCACDIRNPRGSAALLT